MFNEVIYPRRDDKKSEITSELQLKRALRFLAHPELVWQRHPLVVFDFETTGLNASYDRIIEIGAQKIVDFKVVDEFSTLVAVNETLSTVVMKLTGITNEMLQQQPTIESVLPEFLKFIEGSILVAHNAVFDIAFLKAESQRLGIELEWSAFWSLKLARTLLPELESKSLDSLANYYELDFEARHRSIGDVKVTVDCLKEMIDEKGQNLLTWKDLKPFQVA